MSKSTVEILIEQVRACPADITTRLVLADAITETTGRYDAALADADLVAATALINAQGRNGSRLRGALCRMTGATGQTGRPISTTAYRVVAGDSAPVYEGQSYHYETPGGQIVRYPNAYRRAWGKPIYVPASHEITVGARWLLAHVEEMQ